MTTEYVSAHNVVVRCGSLAQTEREPRECFGGACVGTTSFSVRASVCPRQGPRPTKVLRGFVALGSLQRSAEWKLNLRADSRQSSTTMTLSLFAGLSGELTVHELISTQQEGRQALRACLCTGLSLALKMGCTWITSTTTLSTTGAAICVCALRPKTDAIGKYLRTLGARFETSGKKKIRVDICVGGLTLGLAAKEFVAGLTRQKRPRSGLIPSGSTCTENLLTKKIKTEGRPYRACRLQAAPRASVVSLHGLLGRVHRPMSPASRAVRPVSEGPGKSSGSVVVVTPDSIESLPHGNAGHKPGAAWTGSTLAGSMPE